jgi:lysozyme
MINLSPKARTAVAALFFSATGAVTLVLNENFTDHAVIPVPGDVPTIGLGSTEGVKMGDKITVPAAFRRFIVEINKNYEGPLKKCLTAPLSQAEYDSLVDLSYNAGGGAVCREIAPLFNAAKTEEDYAAACKAIEGWRITVKGKDCRDRKNNCYGLVTRRQEERAICEGGA